VWKGIWRNTFRGILTLPLKSTLLRNNGETGMIQDRNIALEIVVFGPQYVGEIITNFNMPSDGMYRWMNEPWYVG
jgi:hypothetical protein